VRTDSRQLKRDYDKTEDDLKALQSVGQIIGEVLRQLDEEKFIVKASSGPRYVVGCRSKVEKAKLLKGTRVALDMTTLTIMRLLPREVDPVVFNMLNEDPGDVSYSSVGGLTEQIRELREVIELPLVNPELFDRVGIKAPKGVLLYGPPGTGKTLLARAISNNIDARFLKVVSSAIVDKYIGESARLIREMFGYAREHQPCIIFMDEIDAIGGRRFSEGTSADREIQRTLMELLNQLDGFDALGKVKMICATNRPDVLDPALLRPGRLDRKIEIPLPNEAGRVEVLKIHANPITKSGDIGARPPRRARVRARNAPAHPLCFPRIRPDQSLRADYESVVKLADGFNAADLRNVCTEAGMFAIRAERDFVIEEDFMKAVRKVRGPSGRASAQHQAGGPVYRDASLPSEPRSTRSAARAARRSPRTRSWRARSATPRSKLKPAWRRASARGPSDRAHQHR
jgi:26S proteasome regulatory subunit T4